MHHFYNSKKFDQLIWLQNTLNTDLPAVQEKLLNPKLGNLSSRTTFLKV